MHDSEHTMMGAMNGGWQFDHWLWPWAMSVHGVFMLLLLALAVVGIVAIVRGVAREGSPSGVASEPAEGGGNAAADALESRYARGEIDRNEYLEKRSELGRA